MWAVILKNTIPVVGSAKESVETAIGLIHGDTDVKVTKSGAFGGPGVFGIDAHMLAVKGKGAEIRKSGEDLINKLVIKGVGSDEEDRALKSISSTVSKKECDLARVNIERNKISMKELVKLTCPKELGAETKKQAAARGEHIINNNVLKVFPDIIQTFVNEQFGENFSALIETGKITRSMKVYQAYMQPMPRDYQEAIMYKLVVHLPPKAWYVDANASIYGIKINYIKKVINFYMIRIRAILNGGDSNRLSDLERNCEQMIEEFLQNEYFVDEYALNIWKSDPKNKISEFNDAKSQVETLFHRLESHGGEVIEWVKEIREATGENKLRK